MDELTQADEFTEAVVIRELIAGKRDSQIIETPAGYHIDVERDFEVSENGKFKFNKIYKIIKDEPAAK